MTAVIDSSALVEYILLRPLWPRVAILLSSQMRALHVPQLVFPETAAALKGIERGHEASGELCGQAIINLLQLSARRWPLEPLTWRAWQLHDNFSVYDAYYVALAEKLDARLITKDARLARAVEAAGLCPVDLVQ